MSSSRYVHIIGCVLSAALLGCAHVPADPPASAAANVQNGSQPPTAASASATGAAQPGTAGAATGASAAQAAAPAATGASAAQASAAAAAQVSPQFLHDALQIGYRPETHSGTTVFCKVEVPVGTRFGRKQCLSPSDLAVMIQHEQEQRDLFRANCGGQGCGGPQSH